MTAIARLGAVSLDASDTGELSRFYQEILGLEVLFERPGGFIALKGGPVLLTIHHVPDLPKVTWPAGPVPKQIHLDLATDDLDSAEKAALAAGATKAPTQPSPDKFRVFFDPAGHPFCFSVLIPKP